MPKKKIIHRDEPLPARPHRNMKAKVVFDPSDNHIPKKRAKYSYKNEKSTEASTVKKTTKDRTLVKRRKRVTTKSKSLPVTELLLDDLSTEINTKSPIVSPINSPVTSVSSEITPEKSKNCFICSSNSVKTELVHCPICLIRAHRHCLIVDEPMWKFKLDLCPWLCKQCRKQNCSKCLNVDSLSKIQRRCITCEVGLHTVCYEACEMKPLHKLESDMYVCIPCMTLATEINPEEEEEEAVVEEAVKADLEDEVDSSRTSSILYISSDEYDTDSKSYISYSLSSDYEKYDGSYTNNSIPNITKWSKDQVLEYLAELLPQKIIDEIIKRDLDGRAVLLLQRNDIVYNMGLKLGYSLLLYKQVRILQSQSTFSRIFWE